MTKVGSIKNRPQYKIIVNRPIIDDIAIKSVVRSNILKLKDRLKNTKAIKFPTSDHNEEGKTQKYETYNAAGLTERKTYWPDGDLRKKESYRMGVKRKE